MPIVGAHRAHGGSPLRHPDIADGGARTGDTCGGGHRLVGAHALQHGVCTDTAGEPKDRGLIGFAALAAMTLAAPNRRATCWRASFRDIATTCSALNCEAARTPDSPTAPSPATTTVLPSWTAAARAACSRSPYIGKGEQRRNHCRVRAFACCHEGAVGQGDADVFALPVVGQRPSRSSPPQERPTEQAERIPNRQCGQLLSEYMNGCDDEVASAQQPDLRADLLHDADELVADSNGSLSGLSPR
jgi:hypothetical protein